jgi:hypothetical protein
MILPSHLTVISKRDFKRQSKLIRIGEELAGLVLAGEKRKSLRKVAKRFMQAKPTLSSVIKEVDEAAAEIDRTVPDVE